MVEIGTGLPGRRREEIKRVLMVSYNYPPTGAYGSVRTTQLAKYLPSHGWRPTVLTVSRDRTKWGMGDPSEGVLPGVKVISAPFPDVLTAAQSMLSSLGVVRTGGPGAETRLDFTNGDGTSRSSSAIRAAFSWAKRWSSFPDRYLLWFPFVFAKGLIELRKAPYDAIYSTSPPVMDHLVAAALQRFSGLPWLADFRDPWSQNPYQESTRLEATLSAKLERAALSGANAITTVSESLAEMLKQLHGERRGGVLCVTNGFDPDDYPGEQRPEGDGFIITYTGMIYGVKRSPETVLNVLEELIGENLIEPGLLRLRLYGPEYPELMELKASLRYPELLELEGVVPRRESLRRQRESTALLIIQWDDPYNAKIYGGKVFEYLGSHRPILAWNPAGGVLDELLARTGAGVSVRDKTELKELLTGWFKEFKQTGTLAYRGHSQEIGRYGWDRLSGEIAGLLDGLVEVTQEGKETGP